MYRCFYPVVCCLACFGLFNSAVAGSALSGIISTHQDKQVDDRDDVPRRELETLVAEPMAMEPLNENFDRRLPGARQTSIRDGITTTTARDANRDIKITEDLKSGIVVEVTRNYGPQDLAELGKNHPELMDYVEMFPDRVENHEIELNLAIKTVYRSPNLVELKKQHAEAFNIYRRYVTVAEEPIK